MRAWLGLAAVLVLLQGLEGAARPGHMVHTYYKCQSQFFQNTIDCREEAARKEALEQEAKRRRRVSSKAERLLASWQEVLATLSVALVMATV